MRKINLHETKTSFYLPLRSASSLLYYTFCKLFDTFEIECDDDINSPTNEMNIIFVRNPVDRFFSTYYYYYKNFDGISDFIDNYKDFVKESKDGHLLPQSSSLIPNENVFEYGIDFYKKYNYQFKRKYNIIQVEKIDEVIEESYNFPSSSDDKLYNYDYSEVINFLPEKLITPFITYYVYFKNYYDFFHHKHIDYMNYVYFDDYVKVCDLFAEEINFFKYKINIYKHSRKFKKR